MLRKPSVRLCLFGIAIAAFPFVSAPAYAQSACDIPEGWISGGTPDPKILAENSLFNSLCDFHQWSWNAFLWSMMSVDGAPRFEGFPTLAQVIDQSYDGPNPTDEAVMLKLRPGKTDHPIDAVAQAGTTGILVAHNKRAVYYSQYVNIEMYDQIKADNWFTAEGLQKEDPNALFDIGNIEYKAAWAIVDDSYQIPGAYTRQAMVPKVATIKVNGVPTIIVPNDPEFETVEVALVALHVVGWVNGHSEAIWATFSPRGLAPIVAQLEKPDPETNTPFPAGNTIASGSATPFYTPGTTLADCNQTQVPIQTVDDATQEFAHVTQVCQSYQSGSVLPDDMSNVAVLDMINHSAETTIPMAATAQPYEEIGAIWTVSDFQAYCDSVASEPPEACKAQPLPTSLQEPSQISGKLGNTFQTMLLGSTVLSNPVIETFTQTDISQDNCFACHNSLQYQPSKASMQPLHASMLNLSHILLQVYVHDLSSN